MPFYTYECPKCKKTTRRFRKCHTYQTNSKSFFEFEKCPQLITKHLFRKNRRIPRSIAFHLKKDWNEIDPVLLRTCWTELHLSAWRRTNGIRLPQMNRSGRRISREEFFEARRTLNAGHVNPLSNEARVLRQIREGYLRRINEFSNPRANRYFFYS